MNRTRMLVFAVSALALSVFVSLFAYRQLQNRSHSSDDLAQVVVAAEKLPLGTRLTEHHLRLAPWSKTVSLNGSFTTPKEVVGRGVIVPMTSNEPVLESKLAPIEAGAGLTSAIPEGMRAVAVKVNDVIGVAGFALPGTRVDVVLTGLDNKVETSKVILENIQILAADQNVEPDANGKPQQVQVITLLVTPEDAQKVALASMDGRIQLALRNPLDLKHRNPAAVRKSSLYASPSTGPPPPKKRARRRVRASVAKTEVEKKPPAPPPVPRTLKVELIQGDKRETYRFEVK